MSKKGNPLLKLIKTSVEIECQLCLKIFDGPITAINHLAEEHQIDTKSKRRKLL